MVNYTTLYARIRVFTLLMMVIVAFYTMIVEPSIWDNFLNFENTSMIENTFYYLVGMIIMLVFSRSLRKESFSKIEIYCLITLGIVAIFLMAILTTMIPEFILDTYIPIAVVGNASIISLVLLRIKVLTESL